MKGKRLRYPPIISYDESGNEEELSIQPISSIRTSKRKVEPTHSVMKKKKRRSNKGKKVSFPNDVAPTTTCDDDNCYTIGAIHIFNDESDYAYDMKGPKLGEAMFDEDEIFENIFAGINVCPKLGEAMFDEYDIFSPPSFDENIYYDESMPPIYDDYCDDTYALKNKDYLETCHHDFNFQLDYASHDSYLVEFAPTVPNEKNFAYVESNKFSHQNLGD